jgi:hypothetical protein
MYIGAVESTERHVPVLLCERRLPPVISRCVMRLLLSLPALLIAWLCSACSITGGSPDDNPPAGDNRPASSEPTNSGEPPQETLAFGESYTWDDG